MRVVSAVLRVAYKPRMATAERAQQRIAEPKGPSGPPAAVRKSARRPTLGRARSGDTAFPTNDSFPERRQRRIRAHAAGLQLTVDLTASRQLRCSSSGAAPSRPR
jgi:hypothetical protein